MFVYVLRSLKDGKRYVGITFDVDKRLRQHNRGEVTSTKGRRPFVLVHYEETGGVAQARIREKYFKTAAGRRYLGGLERKMMAQLVTRPRQTGVNLQTCRAGERPINGLTSFGRAGRFDSCRQY